MNKNHKKTQKKQCNLTTIAIVGGGIIGINCAVVLQKMGYQVTIIDKSGIGEGCSKGNAGHFATEQVFPLADAAILKQLPNMLLNPKGAIKLSACHLPKAIPWFTAFIKNMSTAKFSRHSLALQALNKLSIPAYRNILAEANGEELLTELGSLLVFESTPLHEITAIKEQYLNAGINVKLLNKKEALTLEPSLTHNIKYALYFSDVGHTINPHRLCLTLAKYAQNLGCQFITEGVDRIEHSNKGVVLTTHNKQTLTFNKLVLATGAWSKSLVNTLGYQLPIEAERGYHYQLPAHQSISRPIASAERKFIITPMEEGLRLAGTVEFSGLNSPPNYQRAIVLIDHAKQVVNNLPKPLKTNNKHTKMWMGPRPSLPDSLPVICQAPKHQHIYFALGHQHLGLTQGAITGTLIGQIVSEQPTAINIKPFSINRFQ